MIREALQYIVGLTEARGVQVVGDDRTFTDKPVCAVQPALASPLVVATLGGLFEYLVESPDAKHQLHVALGPPELCPLIAHIVSPSCVQVVTPLLRPHAYREVLVEARPTLPRPRFGVWQAQEEFLIWLQTAFVQDEEVRDIAAVVGTLKEGAVRTLDDDGLSQQVTTSRGLQRVGHTVVPNPVTLRPYRTFAEVEQPASKFVLRMRSSGHEDELPTIALFEVEDAGWVGRAVEAVKAHLEAKMCGETTLRPVVVLA